MANIYDKLSDARQQLNTAAQIFEDIGDAMVDAEIIDTPTLASQLASSIRANGGVRDYDALKNKPSIDRHVLSGDTQLSSLGYAKKAEIPTKTSQLNNDSGFLTQHQSLTAYAQKSELPTKTSDLTNDSGYTTKSYVDGLIGTVLTEAM